ncbi:hypothetical protein RND81_07G025500 [Saponaria officinalis]|uniref:Peptidase S54 rhomboid domain-containing protein n=1 Tax=Saponaria officinalis TaxID=3572 RepID=A0AAW1JK14_SAPOF
MKLGFGGGGSPFPFNNSYGTSNQQPWLPLSTVSATSAHLFTTAISLPLRRSFHRRFSLLLRSSIKGVYGRQESHVKQFSFSGRLSDDLSAACASCLCFFNGKSSSHGSGMEGSSSHETSSNSLFRRGRWTNVLLAINVLLYVAQVASKGKLMLWGAKINSLIDQGQLWRLLTSSFLHANVGHLMINCYSLNSIGPTVENICGTGRFFALYFASAVTSSAMSYWLSQKPAVGASGAIFGLVGSVAMFSLRHRNLLTSGAQSLQHVAQVILLNLIIGLSSKRIDNWGHLGGLLGGVAVSWLIGPAWTYDSTTRDGRKVFIDKAPIRVFSWKNPARLK